MGELNYYHEINKVDATKSTLIKGKLKKIHVETKRRQGNKFVTCVKGLELYGVDPIQVANETQSLFSCSSTTVLLSSNNQTHFRELIIQGKKSKEFVDFLEKEYKVKSIYTEVVE